MIQNIYVILAVLLFCGLALGHVAKLVRLPSITGNILAGILLGPVLAIVNTQSPTVEAQLDPLINVALSLIAISIGSHLQFRKLRNAVKRIVVLGALETLIVPAVVFLVTFPAMWLSDTSSPHLWKAAVFMGILSLATAPASVLHVIKESQARGVFVKTLIAVVVFNNVANIFLFEGAHHWIFGIETANWILICQLFGAILLGIAVAYLLMFTWKRTRNRKQVVTFSFAALIISYGLALQLHLSPVLTNLALGVTVANVSGRNQILDIFEDFEGIIFAIFFTLMGTHARFDHLGSVGLLATIYFLGRMMGNVVTVWLANHFTHLPKKVNHHLGLALTPHAGLTVGLVVSLRVVDNTGFVADFVIPVVLLAVTISEVIGPLVLRISLKRSGEEKQALPHVVDFLQEEYIKVGLKAETRNQAIRQLVNFLFKSHHSLRKLDKEAFCRGLIDREERGDTSITRGLAIPHFSLPGAPKVVGVMGIIRDGIDWQAAIDRPVHVIILIGIPPHHSKQHLGALSTIAKLFRRQSVAERGLHLARTAGEVFEALVDEEFESLNHVLEEDLVGETIPENPELAERFRIQALSSRKLRDVRSRAGL